MAAGVDAPPPVLIRGGTVFDGSGQRPGLRADVLVRDGIVAQIGIDLTAPPDATVIDASDKWVTPGSSICTRTTTPRSRSRRP